jgi:hypothetical protein
MISLAGSLPFLSPSDFAALLCELRVLLQRGVDQSG